MFFLPFKLDTSTPTSLDEIVLLVSIHVRGHFELFPHFEISLFTLDLRCSEILFQSWELVAWRISVMSRRNLSWMIFALAPQLFRFLLFILFSKIRIRCSDDTGIPFKLYHQSSFRSLLYKFRYIRHGSVRMLQYYLGNK